MKTWEEDLESLLKQRKNYFKSLKYLEEQASKVGQRSVGLFHEMEDIKRALRDVEDKIKELEEKHEPELIETGKVPIDRISPESTIAEAQQQYPKDNNNEIGSLLTKSIISQSSDYKRRIPIYFVLIIFLVIIIVIIFSITQQSLFNNTESSEVDNSPANISLNPVQSENTSEIIIHADYYHLGDAVVGNFNHPQPQANPYLAQFEIVELDTESSYLTLYASHVDPNEEQSPISIYINGIFIDKLNSYFGQENLSPKLVTISLDPTVIQVGINEIKIEVSQTNLEYEQPNIDDFEFWGLTLHLQ